MKKNITQLHEITPEELEHKILNGVKDIFIKYLKTQEKVEPTIWLTRKETANFLGVSLVTIHNWSNVRNILTPHKISTQIRFRKSEVEAILTNSREE